MSLQDMKKRFQAAVAISVGLKRTENQDNFLLNSSLLSTQRMAMIGQEIECSTLPVLESGGLFGVFDGMGGETSGEEAAFISAVSAAELRGNLLACSPSADGMLLRNFFEQTDLKVSEEAKKRCAECIGSTGVILWIRDDQVTAANLGDSRSYRVREGELKRLSHDHTPTQELIDAGVYTQEEMDRYPRSAAVSGFFGMAHIGRNVKPYFHSRFTAAQGDVYLLCSDGLTDMLKEKEILGVITSCEQEPETIARALVQAALDPGGEDNVTALVICVR